MTNPDHGWSTLETHSMHPNWLGILAFALTLVVFGAIHRVAKHWPLRRRWWLAVVAAVAAIPGASFAVYYTHLLPEMAWYYQLRSLPGSELLLLFIGLAGGLVASLLPRCVLILPLFGVVALAIAPVLKPFLAPLDAASLHERWKKDVCQQSSASTCGPASAATILRQLGVQATEAELAAAAHSYAGGTEAWYLARALRSRGLDARFDFASDFAPDGGLPAIVGVRFGVTGHFIAVLGRDGERFVIGDPLIGRESLTREQLDHRYTFTGFHLRISRR